MVVTDLLPLGIEITTTGIAPAVSVRNATFLNTELIQLDVQFPGTNNWSIRKDHIGVHFTGDLNTLIYCPPLVENLTVRINRTDYVSPDILNFHIPLSNGLIFVPNSADSNTGCAIIHNASQYHLAPRWISERLSYMTGPIVIPAPYQFFILPHTTVTQAQDLANRLNNQLAWTIGGNASQMQGFEYLNFYFSSIRGELWAGGEWW